MADMQQFDLMSLSFAQMQQVKKQMEEELEGLQAAYTQLKISQRRYAESRESLDALTPGNAGKPIMVPLTSSLYVPGEVGDISNVIVDVGTGYYAEKSIPDAVAYFQRKEDFVQKNLQEVTATINQKRQSLQVLVEVMQAKLVDIKMQSEKGKQGQPAHQIKA